MSSAAADKTRIAIAFACVYFFWGSTYGAIYIAGLHLAPPLVGALRTHRDRAMVLAMLLAGLRRCEVLGLRFADVQVADREQSPEGARQRVLRILQRFDLCRVGQVVGVEVNRGRLGARLGDLNKDVLFLLGEALNGRDQVGNEVGAALILVLNLGPGSVSRLLLGRDDIVAAGGNRNCDKRQNGERSQPIEYAHCQPLRDKTPLLRGPRV